MKKLILGLLIIGSGAEAGYIQGIDNGSYKAYKENGQSLRQFTTNKDGYINIVPTRYDCAESLQLLDQNNRVIYNYQWYKERSINTFIKEGQYYIQVIPKNDCNINVVLP